MNPGKLQDPSYSWYKYDITSLIGTLTCDLHLVITLGRADW